MTVVAIGAAGAGVVVGAAGVTKLVDPAPTTRLFAGLGLRGGPGAARTIGLVEIGVALWLLATGSPWAAAATALAYVVLLGTVLTLRRMSPTTPCGCFGQWSGPPSARHVTVNSLAAATCTLTAATATPVTPPVGTSAAGTLAWWGAVAAVAIAAVIALAGGRTTSRGNPSPDSRTSGDGTSGPTPVVADAEGRR